MKTPPNTRPFHLLAKPTGPRCNLACAYCFFLSKDALFPGDRFRMTDEVQELYLRRLLEGHPPHGEVVVAWQGGEPTLMGLGFFERSIELQERYAGPEQRVLNTIQTNGTLLDDEWGAFLARHRFLVGLSIDGPREVHDAYRRDAAGRGSFDLVMRGLEVLQRHGVEWNALVAVHAANQDWAVDVYQFLRDECGARFIQFIPIVERPSPGGIPQGDRVTERSVAPERWGGFLVEVFEEWVRADIGEVYVQHFDTALANWHGEPGGVCVHVPTCGVQPALEHNGEVYSCDHFVEPTYRLGSIRETPLRDLVDSPAQQAFGRAKLERLPEECLACDVRFACHGGCPKDRIVPTGQERRDLNYLCPGYRRFFRHIDPAMRRMSGLLRQGRPPADLMAELAREDARRGRNEPCPCGSGRKWKQCHGSAGTRGRV